MKKKKICWITSTSFLDVDLPIVPQLQKEYDIEWVIITSLSNLEGDKMMIQKTGFKNWSIHVLNSVFISPMTFFFYRKLLKQILLKRYDLFYLDLSGMPYFHILAKNYLSVDKCIIAAHNVTTPKGARYYHLAKLYMEFVVRVFKKFQVFSNNQLNVLKEMKYDAEILYAPLCLKDYGKPTANKPVSPITFLFFGNIVDYKRLDILLEAAAILEKKGIDNFKVQVSGYCPQAKWNNVYKDKVNRCKNIVTDIRRIPNDLIPDLFEESHYFLMPYQDIAQSGAMAVALCYNIPIIASELDTFKEFLNDNIDGLFFEPGSSQDLANKMIYVINNHDAIYENLRSKQRDLVQSKLLNKSIIEKYKQYLNKLCQS